MPPRVLPSDATSKHLPLTEATYHVLVALGEALHGYAVMQKVEQLSEGVVKLGPGTLYGILSTCEKEGLIVKISEEERRKTYTLTAKGRMVLAAQVRRLEVMLRHGWAVLEQPE